MITRRCRLGAALAVAVVGGVIPMQRAGAELDPSSTFSVVARADAMAIEYLNTAAPVFAHEPIIYGTPATAGSLVTSVGQSTAFAGAPYPGDVMVGMPDNGNGAVTGLGGPGIIPTYPFIVQSEHPIAPEAVQDQSGNRLVARSQQYSSSSEARSGLITGDLLAALQAQASSSAVVDATTGTITATADSRLDAFKLTDNLQVGKSTAHAKISRAPGAEIVKESSFTVGSIVVGGVEMSYSDEGFTFGEDSPEPPGDPAPLFEALEQAGITVEILPAQGTENSIESAGLKITQVQEFGDVTQRISFIVGRVSARIDGEAATLEEGGLLDPFPSSQPAEPEPVVAEAPAPADPVIGAAPAIEEVLEDPGFDLGTVTATLPDLALPPTEVAPPVSGSGTPSPAPQVAAAAPRVALAAPASIGKGLRDDDWSGLYLALGLVAGLLSAGSFVAGRARRPAAVTASVLQLPGR